MDKWKTLPHGRVRRRGLCVEPGAHLAAVIWRGRVLGGAVRVETQVETQVKTQDGSQVETQVILSKIRVMRGWAKVIQSEASLSISLNPVLKAPGCMIPQHTII